RSLPVRWVLAGVGAARRHLPGRAARAHAPARPGIGGQAVVIQSAGTTRAISPALGSNVPLIQSRTTALFRVGTSSGQVAASSGTTVSQPDPCGSAGISPPSVGSGV